MILLIEDEKSVLDAVSYALEQEGFDIASAMDGHAALKLFEERIPDLVVLDLMLPGVNGWELFSAFRRKQPRLPVIMLTARVEESDRVAGLEMGADDYVTKPFSMRELVARVRAVLRRSEDGENVESTVLERAGVIIDAARHEVKVNGTSVSLSPKEFDLLAYLMAQAGRVRSREEILRSVWGQDEYLDERTVDVHIRWLRKKVEVTPETPSRILTVRGVGYKFTEADI